MLPSISPGLRRDLVLVGCIDAVCYLAARLGGATAAAVAVGGILLGFAWARSRSADGADGP